MNQQDFDKLVRGKLSTIEAEQAADSWELFSEKWTATEATSAAAVDAFDQVIQDKIGAFSALETTDVWDVFEQRLAGTASTPTVDASELDNTIYNKLYNYRVPYDASTWGILLNKLRARTWQKVEIAVYKTVELALLFLLFFFGQQFFTFTEVDSLPIAIENQRIAQQQTVTQEEATIAIDEEKVRSNVTISTSETTTTDNLSTVTDGAALVPPIEHSITEVTTETVSNAIILPVKANEKNTAKINSVKEFAALEVPLKTIEHSQSPSLWVEEVVDILPSILGEVETASKDELAQVLLLAPEKKRTVRFGMFGAGAVDYIFTPQDRLFTEIAAYDRYSPGYGGGFSFGKQFLNNRWEVETGLMYISKRYSQQVVAHVFGGSLRNGYEVDPTPSYVEMNIINIPINFRYNLVNNNKWKFYGLGGASLQLILQANYDRENLNNILLLSAAPPGGLENSPNSSSKRFNRGFLADSNFRNNRYFSYNVGIGLERFVSPRWSLFAQPTYQHTIKAFNSEGLGPNRDRINTMMIMLGAKVGL